VGVALSLAGRAPARADEPMFGYVSTTDLLPRGKAQVEQWVTARSDGTLARSEAEYGATDNLQLTGYLNYGEGPDGVTAEAAWRLASPYLSPLGLALVADATVGRGRQAGRVRAVLQKNLRDDALILAANLWIELADRPRTTTVEADAGVSYRFRPNWSAGLEYRGQRTYAGHGPGERRFTAHLAGPTVHYGGRRWFFTLSAQRRLGAAGSFIGARPARWDGVRFRLGRTF
jgi:hypothetical protein